MIFILTGAGISQESWPSTLHENDALWEEGAVADVVTPEAFSQAPERILSFYNSLRRRLLSDAVVPNAAHLALARLEASVNEDFVVVTQNIDDLHERAGSKKVLHMHGQLLKAYCTICESHSFWKKDLTVQSKCAACGRIGSLRPPVVGFGERPLYMEEIEEALSHCYLFVSIGTSSLNFPAASFAEQAKARGAILVELNLEPTANSHLFHERIYGAATEVVPRWVGRFLGLWNLSDKEIHPSLPDSGAL
ncbi:NAD-dependent deacylase [Desulfovibrio sp. OttesenSCG-928-G15]|nr:NAD-dependent deacylase [Desulfovibrio sp. OttesenSCG-928-G15]